MGGSEGGRKEGKEKGGWYTFHWLLVYIFAF